MLAQSLFLFLLLTFDSRSPTTHTDIRDRFWVCAMRDAAINLPALPQQRDLIDQAAQVLGKKRSDFMLEAACDKAQAVLLDRVLFSLEDAKFRNSPNCSMHVQPNPGLERLLAVKAPWATAG
jgi:uncharacterized protein (DUF1778 family)